LTRFNQWSNLVIVVSQKIRGENEMKSAALTVKEDFTLPDFPMNITATLICDKVRRLNPELTPDKAQKVFNLVGAMLTYERTTEEMIKMVDSSNLVEKSPYVMVRDAFELYNDCILAVDIESSQKPRKPKLTLLKKPNNFCSAK
jgi:hypothetical protein